MIDRRAVESWKLHGMPLQIFRFAAAAFLAAGLLAAAIDLLVVDAWDAPTTQAWTLVPQVVATWGLLHLGRRCGGVSFFLLAGVVALVTVEEAFHVLNTVQSWLASVVKAGSEATGLSPGVVDAALIYGLVAMLGLSIIWVSHLRGSVAERPVVRNLALLLIVGGVFGGPGNAFSVYVEEFGEAAAFAIIAAYVMGLVYHSRLVCSSRNANTRGAL
jgi:hypothetical protein